MSTPTKLDIRWKQRFFNFRSAFEQLEKAVQLSKQRKLSDLEKQGLIQAFEFTHEIAWNVMKDYFEFQGGGAVVTGSRDATREAFNRDLLSNGDVWMEMIKSRNQTPHTYNRAVADEIVQKIIEDYFHAFDAFQIRIMELSQNE